MKGVIAMQFYEIQHIVDNKEWESKLTDLANRCKDINGWTEKDVLQFAVISMPMYEVWLMYLDYIINDLEQSKKQKCLFDKLSNKDKKEI